MAETSVAALRWRILRKSLLSKSNEDISEDEIARVSRVPSGSFGFIKARCVDQIVDAALWEYILPDKHTKILLRQAQKGQFKLNDHSTCRELGVDNTGVVCLWPAEEILSYYCLLHREMFRNKRVIELGAGYGLAGLVVAACTEADEVLITDGNPKVVDYIQQNIDMNRKLFGNTKVQASILYWSKEIESFNPRFDIIIAADCTYFKDFHVDLTFTIKSILRTAEDSLAMLFCPARGKTLEEFVKVAKSTKLEVTVKEEYDGEVWKLHNTFLDKGNEKWLNYDKDHNYPLLISITNI